MFIYQKIRTLVDNLQAKDKSLRIQDIANALGIAKGSFENYRDGVNKPTVEVLEKIAIYFGRDMNYFFDSSFVPGEKNPIVSDKIEIYEPETDLTKCYKIMFEQQKEIADQQKEITELKVEIERIKNANAVGGTAKAG